jgi:hypothetical protein
MIDKIWVTYTRNHAIIMGLDYTEASSQKKDYAEAS